MTRPRCLRKKKTDSKTIFYTLPSLPVSASFSKVHDISVLEVPASFAVCGCLSLFIQLSSHFYFLLTRRLPGGRSPPVCPSFPLTLTITTSATIITLVWCTFYISPHANLFPNCSPFSTNYNLAIYNLFQIQFYLTFFKATWLLARPCVPRMVNLVFHSLPFWITVSCISLHPSVSRHSVSLKAVLSISACSQCLFA